MPQEPRCLMESLPTRDDFGRLSPLTKPRDKPSVPHFQSSKSQRLPPLPCRRHENSSSSQPSTLWREPGLAYRLVLEPSATFRESPLVQDTQHLVAGSRFLRGPGRNTVATCHRDSTTIIKIILCNNNDSLLLLLLAEKPITHLVACTASTAKVQVQVHVMDVFYSFSRRTPDQSSMAISTNKNNGQERESGGF